MSPIEYAHLRPAFDNYPGASGRPRYFYQPTSGMPQVVVSIVTATYNPKPLFEDTVAAVFGQSLQVWEWLVVDDASDDALAQERLRQLGARDWRVRLLRQPVNLGLAAGRNLALAHAQGRYVFFLDDDDLIEPTALEKLAWFLEAHPHLTMAKGSTVAFGGQSYYGTANFDVGNLFLERNPVAVMSLVRREALQVVGGFDAALVHGLEDWDLWLKLAAHGYWGGGIPEFLDWYRRRPNHTDRWQGLTRQGVGAMRAQLKQRYPDLFRNGIPRPVSPPRAPYAPLSTELPFANRLAKDRPRMLVIMPWMATDSATRSVLHFLQGWTRRGYECTVVTTLDHNYALYREYARVTPDIFIMPYFLPMGDYSRFLDYLIGSRQYDVVLVSNSELGYQLLPYLRARHPDVAYVDYNHAEADYWDSSGHPRRVVAFQEVLDLNLAASAHLKAWMAERGADPEQVEVLYTNVDTARLKPDLELRAPMRAQHKKPDDKPVILFIGHMREQRQSRVVTSVLRELKRRHKRFVCLVLEDRKDLPWLRRFTSLNDFKKQVRIMGAVSNEVMREYLAAGDILFLPSQTEGIALAVYEAMAMGLTIVGADLGGRRELVTPECGILIECPGDVENEAQRYVEALSILLDAPERRRSLGVAARVRIDQHFRLPGMGEAMAQALLERAPALHATRPKAVPGIALALEYIQITLEEQRSAAAFESLIKYTVLENLRQRVLSRVYVLWQRFQHSALWWRVLKPFKDALLTTGNRIGVWLGWART